jgi:peroxiredoxin
VRSRLAAFVLMVCGLASACSSTGSVAPAFVPASGPMPAIIGRTLDDQTFGPADYRDKIVVVNFWNQDCPPCREEQAVLEADFKALSSRGMTVVGLLYVGGNWPNDPAAARSFLRENGVTYPNLLDGSSELSRAFAIAGIPSTVVVDRDGQLRFRILGRVRPGQLEELIGQLD